MIDWNKRNGGFLSPESVYEDQLGNLSQQINEKDKEIERLNNIINELDNLISIKIIREVNEENYHIDINDVVEIKNKLLELKGSEK